MRGLRPGDTTEELREKKGWALHLRGKTQKKLGGEGFASSKKKKTLSSLGVHG